MPQSDVLTPIDFQELHVEFARNVPLDRLDPESMLADGNADIPLYVVCRSGSRGKQACEKFLAVGHSNVVNVEGGTLACEAVGLPITHGKKSISLEHQVWIAAGALVVIGSALGAVVHPCFIGLVVFVGAGLGCCGYHGHVRHGHVARSHALESSEVRMHPHTACWRSMQPVSSFRQMLFY